MPTSITVHGVPDDARDELAARAARSGRSLDEYVLSELIELARRPDTAEVLAGARERLRRTGTSVASNTIRAYLDEDRSR